MSSKDIRAMLNQLVDHLKNISPSIAKAMEVSNSPGSDIDWLAWFDSDTEIVYFQAREDYDGRSTGYSYGFKFFDPESPSVMTRRLSIAKLRTRPNAQSARMVGQKSQRIPTSEEESMTGIKKA